MMMLKKKINIRQFLSVGLIYILIAFILTGCELDPEPAQESITDFVSAKAGTVQLYHATADKVVPDEERYQLKQPDNLPAAVEEVIEAMTYDDSIGIEKYLVDENNGVTLFMHFADGVTAEARLLNEAAIVKSIEELDINGVGIVLLDDAGNEIERATYTDSSFYYYEQGE